MSDSIHDQVQRCAAFLKGRIKVQPKVGMILGSGLGTVADKVEQAVGTPYAEIDGFPRSSVAGHAGKLVAGTLAGKPVIVMAGRAHLYEGTPVATVVFPVRVMKALGVEILLVTNAAGGLNGNYLAGSFMIIKDHINLLGVNPLAGPNDERLGPRFPDMTVAYDADLREKAKKAAVKLGMTVPEGVYAAMPGPSYETPAEIRMLRGFGADAVGMSTVPEVIAARHAGMRVVGISFISNAAAGLSAYPLTHEEVQREADKARAGFEKLVLELVAAL